MTAMRGSKGSSAPKSASPTAQAKLSDLVAMNEPEEVLGEVFYLLRRIDPAFSVGDIGYVFDQVWRLYCGNYPGYRSCNTGFHDFYHTTDVLLAHTRLIHGAILSGLKFNQREITLALIAALLHDVGYIQEIDDYEGRGGKFTQTHVTRGCEFTAHYRTTLRLDTHEVEMIQAMLRYTDLAIPYDALSAPTPECEELGRLLGAADLYGQMADRCYLEKLTYLYEEFRDGQIDHFESAEDLMVKTMDFYTIIHDRLEWLEPRSSAFFRSHFNERWQIDDDLYHVAIERQKAYLQQILSKDTLSPQRFLRRHVKLPPGMIADSPQCNDHEQASE